MAQRLMEDPHSSMVLPVWEIFAMDLGRAMMILSGSGFVMIKKIACTTISAFYIPSLMRSDDQNISKPHVLVSCFDILFLPWHIYELLMCCMNGPVRPKKMES